MCAAGTWVQYAMIMCAVDFTASWDVEYDLKFPSTFPLPSLSTNNCSQVTVIQCSLI